jgi:hypothetical protein
MREIYRMILEAHLQKVGNEELEILQAACDGDPEFAEVFFGVITVILLERSRIHPHA